jgi:WD40 repeat protein
MVEREDLHHTGYITEIIRINDSIFATCADDTCVILWSLPNDRTKLIKYLHTFRGHQSPITCVDASNNFGVLATGDKRGRVIIWDLNRRVLCKSIEVGSPIHCINFNQNTVPHDIESG